MGEGERGSGVDVGADADVGEGAGVGEQGRGLRGGLTRPSYRSEVWMAGQVGVERVCAWGVWQAYGGRVYGGRLCWGGPMDILYTGAEIGRSILSQRLPISGATLLYTPQGLLISRRARSIIYPEAIPGGATEALLHGRIYISQGCPVHRFDTLVPSGTCTAHILAGRGTLVVGI